jgi:hypothetical protein
LYRHRRIGDFPTFAYIIQYYYIDKKGVAVYENFSNAALSSCM